MDSRSHGNMSTITSNFDYTQFQTLTPTEKKQLEEETKLAVKQVGPRVYLLAGCDDETVQFYVMGCQGNGGDSQKSVAALMERIMRETNDSKAAFVLVTGDNIYDYGVDTPLHPGFQDCFHSIYKNIRLPFMLLLGNHDENFHAKASLGYAIQPGEDTAINEVAHSYLPVGADYATIVSKVKLYQQNNLDLSKLPQWNMPYFYYSIIAGDLQIFCLDSNTYAKDFLDLQAGVTNSAKINQAAWLKTEFANAKLAGRKTVVAMHHPLYTSGKRAFPAEYDSKHYLSTEQVKKLNEIMHGNLATNYTSSFNALLAEIFQTQGINFDLALAAHDHFMSYYNNKLAGDSKIPPLVTTGGGGGDLQGRSSFVGHPYVACHFQDYGCAKITCAARQPQTINIDIYTTSGHHLSYNTDNHLPLRNNHTDPQVEKIRLVVRKACDDYLSALKRDEGDAIAEKPNNSYVFTNLVAHGIFKFVQYMRHDAAKAKEIICVQNIIGYLDQPDLPNFNAIIDHLSNLTSIEKLPNRETVTSFFKSFLQKNLSEGFGQDLTSLYDTVHADKLTNAPAIAI